MTTVRVGIGVMIYKGNKILLGKRKGSHGSGTWAFPGGHLDYGESWEECSIRETLEETGITIQNIKYYKTTNNIFHNENKHYVTIFMKAEYVGGDVKVMEPEKCEQWDWFEISKLPQPLFLPYDKLLEK